MFLHFGENNLIKTKDIVGVFDVEILRKSIENDRILKDASDDRKTLIIGNAENYFSNISVNTINDRISSVIK